jgi:hypothetical protein
MKDVETLSSDSDRSAMEKAVWARSGGKCESGCGSTDRLKIVMHVPDRFVPANAIVFCRTCELAAELAHRDAGPASGVETRPINFWVSKKLHARLTNGLSKKYGFKSIASLVRYLMSKYVLDSDRFDDVAQWQDAGSDVKVNVWVPRDTYEVFQTLAEKNGLTVTDALKGLIRMYESEVRTVVESRTTEE